MFHTKFVNIFMIHHHTKFHIIACDIHTKFHEGMSVGSEVIIQV